MPEMAEMDAWHLGEKNIAPDMIRVDQPLLPPKYPVQLANDIQKIQKEI